jgi:hypothetical protein
LSGDNQSSASFCRQTNLTNYIAGINILLRALSCHLRRTASDRLRNKWNLKWIGNGERESEFVRNFVFDWQKMMRESEEGFR